jgi:hypothetical protein
MQRNKKGKSGSWHVGGCLTSMEAGGGNEGGSDDSAGVVVIFGAADKRGLKIGKGMLHSIVMVPSDSF